MKLREMIYFNTEYVWYLPTPKKLFFIHGFNLLSFPPLFQNRPIYPLLTLTPCQSKPSPHNALISYRSIAYVPLSLFSLSFWAAQLLCQRDDTHIPPIENLKRNFSSPFLLISEWETEGPQNIKQTQKRTTKASTDPAIQPAGRGHIAHSKKHKVRGRSWLSLPWGWGCVWWTRTERNYVVNISQKPHSTFNIWQGPLALFFDFSTDWAAMAWEMLMR